MCSTCGCGATDGISYTLMRQGNHDIEVLHHHGDGHFHHHHDHHEHQHTEHGHDHRHQHTHASSGTDVLTLERDILHQNQLLAERNRGFLEARGVKALNLVSSPGSGKTSLLEKTLEMLAGQKTCQVIEGDQQTSQDAERIAGHGAPVVQINTGKGCHLDASMVNRALKDLDPKAGSYVFIENVGNLVCPAMFDLGEQKRVVIVSVTEGTDKPIKYPDMFHTSQLCIINKIDLLPYVDFDVDKMKEYALRVNPKLQFLEVSATRGEGMTAWVDWLQEVGQS